MRLQLDVSSRLRISSLDLRAAASSFRAVFSAERSVWDPSSRSAPAGISFLKTHRLRCKNKRQTVRCPVFLCLVLLHIGLRPRKTKMLRVTGNGHEREKTWCLGVNVLDQTLQLEAALLKPSVPLGEQHFHGCRLRSVGCPFVAPPARGPPRAGYGSQRALRRPALTSARPGVCAWHRREARRGEAGTSRPPSPAGCQEEQHAPALPPPSHPARKKPFGAAGARLPPHLPAAPLRSLAAAGSAPRERPLRAAAAVAGGAIRMSLTSAGVGEGLPALPAAPPPAGLQGPGPASPAPPRPRAERKRSRAAGLRWGD